MYIYLGYKTRGNVVDKNCGFVQFSFLIKKKKKIFIIQLSQ